MATLSLKELLEAGVHFGHRTPRWHPKMHPYIFTERNGIHIIDLQQTVTKLEEAMNKVREAASEGGSILFVGTKKQAQESIAEAAQSCGMPFVNQRWLGGTLTNFRTIRRRIDQLLEIEARYERGEFAGLSKKEIARLERELARLRERLGGLREMRTPPQLLFVVDTNQEEIAVREAQRLGIPVVAMLDTNSNPEPIAYPIPSNDDAIRAIKLIATKIAEAARQGRAAWETARAEEHPVISAGGWQGVLVVPKEEGPAGEGPEAVEEE